MINREGTTILKGEFQEAVYKNQELEEYSYNPFIEALPPIFTAEDVIDRFTVLPAITDVDRNKTENLRYHIIKRTKNFLQPLPIHIELERKLSTLIRRGYLGRNPLDKSFLGKLRVLNRLDDTSIKENELQNELENIRTTADSISIIGISGIRNNNLAEIIKYEDISIDYEEVANVYARNIELTGIIKESFKERRKDIELQRKSTIESLIVELTEMDIFQYLELSNIRKICEKIVNGSSINEDYSNFKKEALKEAMALNEKMKLKEENRPKQKVKGGLLEIYELSRERNIHPYELLKKEGYIKNPVDEFLNVN